MVIVSRSFASVEERYDVVPRIRALLQHRCQYGKLEAGPLFTAEVLEDASDARKRPAPGPGLGEGVVQPDEPALPIALHDAIRNNLFDALNHALEDGNGDVVTDVLANKRELWNRRPRDSTQDVVGSAPCRQVLLIRDAHSFVWIVLRDAP